MIKRPDQENIDLLNESLKRSQRTGSVRLSREFVRDSVSPVAIPPLAELLRGGGEVRIKVYLTVLMMATAPPHATRVSARDLAKQLGLSNPDVAGARRVSKAFKDLEEAGLVKRTGKHGHVPTTQILNPSGSGSEWNDRELEEGYISLPLDLWRRGWIIALNGRSLALLVILRELTGGRKKRGTWVDSVRKRQYGLSDDTWTKATKELCDAGLLEVDQQIQYFQGEPRKRNLYSLELAHLGKIDPGESIEN